MSEKTIPLAKVLARYAKTANIQKIPRARKLRLLWCLADYIACTVAASDLKEANTAFVLSDTGSVKIPGLEQHSFSRQGAAIAAGSLGSLLQLHDGYGNGGNHPSSVLIPSLIAATGGRGLTSVKSINALGIGYEICNRLAAFTHPQQSFLGSAPTSTMGSIGAAITAGLCFGLNDEKLAEAISIAAFFAPIATFEALKVRGSAVPLHSGIAARTGIEAAQLAFKGFSGGPTVLEGRPNHPGLLDFLGSGNKLVKAELKSKNNQEYFNTNNWNFKTIDQVYFKPFPGCRHIQPAVEALIAAHRKSCAKPQDILSIKCYTYPLALAFANQPKKNHELYDKLMSIPWGLASVILEGKPSVQTLKKRCNSSFLGLYDKIFVGASKKYTDLYPDKLGAMVEITLKNKNTFIGECALNYGGKNIRKSYTPAGGTIKPLEEADMAGRFLDLTAPVIGQKNANKLLRKFNPNKSSLIKTS